MSSDSPSPSPIQETATGSDNSTLESQNPVEDSQESKKSRRAHDEDEEEEGSASPPPPPAEECSGRERLKRHRVEMSGRVWIPDMWGQEGLLKEWADCKNFDASLVRSSILMARDSLANDGRRRVQLHSTELALRNSC